MTVTRRAARTLSGARAKKELTLIARFLRACNRTPLRGKTRLTLLLAGWLKQLQAVPIEIAGMTVYMDLRMVPSHFWLMGTPFERSPYEVAEQEIMRRLLIPGDVAFDIGANLGIHTVLLAQLVGPDGSVFAFEPNPEMLLTLALTIEALTNTIHCLFALSDENSDATLFVPADHSMASLKDWTSDPELAGFRTRLGLGCVQTFTVPQRSIDGLVIAEALPMPDFIKCDAEGAELKIFRGARETLDRIGAPTILFEAGPDTARGFGQKLTDAAEFLSDLPRAGYRFFELNEGGALTPVCPNDFREQNQNVLAVPAQRLVHVAARCTIRVIVAMNVLFVLPSFPLPAHSGGAIAAIETLRSLHPHCSLSLLVPPPARDKEANESSLRDLLPGVRLHFYAALSPHPSHSKIYRTAALSMLRGRSYWELIWFNRDLRDAVVRLTAQERFDVVHCEWLQPAASLAGLDLPLVIRELDVHFIRMREGAERRHGLKRAFWRMQANRLRTLEVTTLRAAAAVVTLSIEDEAVLLREGVGNILTIPPPCSVPIDPTSSASEPGDRSLAVFIGRLDDDVNRDAFLLFARKVWPHVHADVRARARVVFAGGFPDDEVRRCAAECGLEIHAPLSDDDADRLLDEADVVLLPVASGTGIKVKTLKAMARGKATIGFANAFRGVPVTHGVDALIADSPAQFARLFEMLIDDASRREATGAAARELIRGYFDPESLATRLIDVYRQAGSV